MEQKEVKEWSEDQPIGMSANQPGGVNDTPAIALSSESGGGTALPSQAGGGTCPTCGGAAVSNRNSDGLTAPPYIYALGRAEPRCPNPGVEKELAQATGRAETAGLTDREALHKVLSRPRNRYLIRQLCWVLTIEGLETYILQPCCPSGFEQLVKALRPAPRPTDVDVVIGVRGPIAPPEICNGLMVPIVVFDQMYSFDVELLIESLRRREEIDEEQLGSAAEELFYRIIQMADNAGATDEHRALNYLAVRYDAIYAKAAEYYAQNSSLTAVDVRPSRLSGSGTGKVLDVIFSFTNRQTDVAEKWFARVNVQWEWPFLITKLSPYYDR